MANENVTEVYLDLNTLTYKKRLKQVESDSYDSGMKSGKGFGKAAKKGLSSVDVFKGLIGANIATAGFTALSNKVKESVQDLRDFSKATAEINSILPRTGQLTKETKDQFVEMSKSFGGKAATQANAFYSIVSAGVKSTSKQLSTLATANKAAVAGLVDINEASKVLVSSVNSYTKSGLTATQASDALFIAVREGQTTFGELSSSLGQVAPLAASAGLSFTELSGTLAFITKSGVSTAEAVTQVKAAMTAFIKPTAQLTAALGGANLETHSFAQLMEIIKEKTGGSNQALAKLFPNVRALSGIVTIVNGDMDDFNRILNETEKSAGATSTAFKTIADQNLDFKIELLNAKFSAMGLNIARNVIPYVLDLAKTFEAAFTGFGRMIAPEESLNKQIRKSNEEIDNQIQKIETLKAANEKARESGNVFTDLFQASRDSGIEDETKKLSEMKLMRDGLVETQREANAEKRTEIELDKEKADVKKQTGPDTSGLSGIYDELIGKQNEVTASGERMNSGFSTQAAAMVKTSKQMSKQISTAMINIMAKGVSTSFNKMGSALASGDSAMKAFTDNFKKMLGDMATSMGTMLMAQGLAMFFSPNPEWNAKAGPLIAAGAALATLGGFLGGGSGASGSSSGGATTAGGDTGFSDSGTFASQQIQDEPEEADTRIAVNIQGDVLDSEESGLRIVKLIQDAFDTQGAVIV